MTKFLDKSFSVPMGGDQQYRDNWEATFGKKATEMPSADERRAWFSANIPPGTKLSPELEAERAALSSCKEERPEPPKEPEPKCGCWCDGCRSCSGIR